MPNQGERTRSRHKSSAEEYLDIVGVIVVALDAEAKITFINRKGCEFLGSKEKEEALGKNWFDNFVPADIRDEVRAVFRKLMAGDGQSVERYENAIITGGDAERIIAWHNAPLMDEGGSILGTLSWGEDVTESRQTEDRLEGVARDLRERVKELECLYAISNATQKYDASLEEILQEVVSIIPAAWQYPEVACAQLAVQGQVFRTENFKETAWKQAAEIIADGIGAGTLEVFYLEERPECDEGPFMKEERALTNAIAERASRIIERKRAESSLRESEAKYATLVEQAKEGVVVVQDDVCRFANRAVGDISGYSVEELLGMQFIDMVVPEYRADVAQRCKHRLSGGEGLGTDYETTIRCKDGTIKDVEASVGIVEFEGRPAEMALVRDVTERKRVDQALRESEERYRDLVENANDVIYAVDGVGTITYVSPAVEWYLGYAPPECMGRSFAEFLHPDDRQRASTACHSLLSGGLESNEYRYLAKSGEVRWMRTSSRPKYDGDRVVGIRGVLVDTTERRRAEESLRESERKYRLLADNVQDVIWTTDMDLNVTYVSPSVTRLVGFSVEEAMAMGVPGLLTPASLGDGMRVFQEQLAIVGIDNEDPSRSWTLEVELKCKDGSTVWVEEKMTFLWDSEGAPVGLLGVTRDLTERRQADAALRRSEELFRTVYERSPIGLALYDSDGCLVDANAAFLGMFGLSSFEEAEGPPLLEDPNLTSEGRQRLLAGKTVKHEGPFDFDRLREAGWYRTNRSGIAYLYALMTPLVVGEEGTVSGFMVQVQDMTERRQARQELEQLYEQERALRKEVEAEMKRRAEFLRALVHELKTPLTAVLASSGALVAGLEGGPLLGFAKNLNRGAYRLNSRIDELIDLAKGEIGMLTLSCGSTNLAVLLQEIADEMAPLALSRKQTLTVDLPRSLPAGWVDAGRLRQVVVNLLANACKFTPEGGDITLRASESDGHLLVEVEDTGPGIAPEEKRRLFDPYQLRQIDGRRTGGLGLGLVLSKMLVERHGGQIWVTGREGKGSIFSFTIPLRHQRVRQRSQARKL